MDVNDISGAVIGCAIEVHKLLGPGLLESIYESALCYELTEAGIEFERQKELPIRYKQHQLGQYRLDLVVEKQIVVELKSVERWDPVFSAQVLGYMKMGNYPVGLLINFNTSLLKHGIKRFVI
jgi:GxxExxY protein